MITRCCHAGCLLLVDIVVVTSHAAAFGVSHNDHNHQRLIRKLAPDGSVQYAGLAQQPDDANKKKHKGKDSETDELKTSAGDDDSTAGEIEELPHVPAKKYLGLPAWAAMLVGGLSAALVVICTNLLGARLGSTLPFGATSDQKLKFEVEQAVEKVAVLEIALKDKIEEERKKAEEEARAAAGEEKKEEPPGPSYDELVGEMLYRTKETQGKAIDGVNNAIRQAAPVLARASHIQTVFTDQMQSARDKVTNLGKEQVGNMYSRMKEAMGVDMEAADMAEMGAGMTGMDMPDWLTVDEDDLDPPPFALLLGGMMAPMQLAATKANCTSAIVSNSVMLSVVVACSVMDAYRHCPDNLVWAWQYGMISINALDVICNSFLISRCTMAMGTLKEDEERMGNVRKTGNGVWDAYIAIQSHSGQFFKAYFAYQSVVDSKVYSLQKSLSFVVLVWGCMGVWITCEDVVKDSMECDAKVILWFMHAYSFFFVLTLFWTVLGLIFWGIQKASSSTSVTGPILQTAKEMDDQIVFKLPVWQTITRGLILRDSSTMLRIKAKQFATDLEESTQKLEIDKALRDSRANDYEELEVQREYALVAEQALIDAYKDKLREQGEYVPEDFIPSGDDDDPDGGGGASSSGGGGGGFGFGGGAGASSSSGFFGFDGAAFDQQLQQAAAAGAQVSAADVMAASSGAQQGAADLFASAQAEAPDRFAGLAVGAQGLLATAQQEAAAAGVAQGATDLFAAAQQEAAARGVTEGAANLFAAAQQEAAARGVTEGATNLFAAAQQEAAARGVTEGATSLFAAAQQEASARGLAQGLTREGLLSGAQGLATSAGSGQGLLSGAQGLAAAGTAQGMLSGVQGMAAGVAGGAASAQGGESSSSASASLTGTAPPDPAATASAAVEATTSAPAATASPAVEVAGPESAGSTSAAAAQSASPLPEATPSAAESPIAGPVTATTVVEPTATEQPVSVAPSGQVEQPVPLQQPAPAAATSSASSATASVAEPIQSVLPVSEGVSASSSSSAVAAAAAPGTQTTPSSVPIAEGAPASSSSAAPVAAEAAAEPRPFAASSPAAGLGTDPTPSPPTVEARAAASSSSAVAAAAAPGTQTTPSAVPTAEGAPASSSSAAPAAAEAAAEPRPFAASSPAAGLATDPTPSSPSLEEGAAASSSSAAPVEEDSQSPAEIPGVEESW